MDGTALGALLGVDDDGANDGADVGRVVDGTALGALLGVDDDGANDGADVGIIVPSSIVADTESTPKP